MPIINGRFKIKNNLLSDADLINAEIFALTPSPFSQIGRRGAGL
jgi:hypothetical protein